MADYRGAQAYNFALFEPQTAVPQPKKKRAPGPQRVVKPKPKSLEELKAEAREANKRIAKIVCVAVVLLSLLGSVIFSQAQLTMLALEVESSKTTLEQQESENVRLKSALAQKMSMDEIEEYATKNLGMVKSSRAQIKYITVTKGNAVVYYEGEAD